MSEPGLGRTLLGLLPGRQGDAGAIDTLLAGLFADARAAWPQVTVVPGEFLSHLARLLPVEGDLAAALAAVRGRDLYLAFACARGDAAALAEFEASYAPDVDAALRGMSLAPDVHDEVKQELRRKLFVAAEGLPKIADYAGRADLRSWLRTAAVRTALGLLRGAKEIPVGDEVLAELPDAGDDPEVAHLKRTYAGELRAAFAEALHALSVRQRNLLRHHFVDGLTIDQIGAVYGVHKTTAFRWLEGARETLGESTRAAFARRVAVDDAQVQSLLRLVRSQVELSVKRLLK